MQTLQSAQRCATRRCHGVSRVPAHHRIASSAHAFSTQQSATQLCSIRVNAFQASHTQPGFLRLASRRDTHILRAAAAEVARSLPADKKDTRVPVTVITGFLGSGKTTLLNHILTAKHGRRIAVIENEFGEIDIDSELVVKKEVLEGTTDTVLQLSNGCLCCTVRDDLIQALNKLYDRRNEFDHIVIETTGLANPAPIISSFYMDKSLPDKCRLDGVVTVVDALNITRHLDVDKGEGVVNEAVEQVAYADRILLNKTDLVKSVDLDPLEIRLREINKLAEIRRTQKSKVDVSYVLGVKGFDLENVEKELDTTLRREGQLHSHHHDDHAHDCHEPNCTHESHSHDHAHDHDHDHAHDHDHDCKGADCTHESHSHAHDGHAHASSHSHDDHDHDCNDPNCTHESHQTPAALKHDDKVSSVSLLLEGDMDLDKINYSLGLLLETRSEDIYRMKGLLSIYGSQFRYVYQGVHSIFEGVPDREWRPDEKRMCKMVFIGRDLDREAFKEAFDHCLVKPKKEAATAGAEAAAA